LLEDGVMRTTIVIPARYQSSRFPGKPLILLRGTDGAKSLVQRTWEAAQQVPNIARVVVATDDQRIAEHVTLFGGDVVMTPTTCRNGTERCAAALDHLDQTDIVVNLQGDAPLTPPSFVTACIQALSDPRVDVATPVLRCDASTLKMFRSDRAAGRVGGTTAVFTPQGRALYFSKEVLPYVPETYPSTAPIPVFHHVGLYAYRPNALRRYARMPESHLETLEGLEQIRFLVHGMHVQTVQVEAEGRVFWEVNNPVDVVRIEGILASKSTKGHAKNSTTP
jgi:3-deoxy-manno-octulosonate cytidylyltransferase (CMP-KDO synthetase)